MAEGRRFGIIHPLYLSFFSKELYRDVAQNWKGYGILYLFSAVALCMIPFVLLIQSVSSDYLSREAPPIITQLPAVTIQKGVLSIDRPEPYFVRDKKTGTPIILFDTLDKTDPPQKAKVPVLVLKTEIVVRGEHGEVRHFDLAGIDGFHADSRLFFEWLDDFEDSFAAVFYPFAVLLSFIFRVLEVAVLAAVGGIFTRSRSVPLSYGALARLSSIAMTPAMVVGAVFTLAGAAIPFWWIAGVPISFSYLYYGIKA
ncbi:MAG: DUF1189 family protein, partial [Nitrospiraceae bacterium]|nr:DUF1189 family protein [Nitrospiraceae bacterium]